MQREKLHDLLRQRPFLPFCVYLQDGRVYEIHYPEINLLWESHITIGIPVPNDPDPVYDYTVLVPLSQIARVELLPVPAPPAAN